MPDKTYNKVVINGNTYMDISEDTVTEDTILEGYTAHDRNGAQITGTVEFPVTDVEVNGTSVVDGGIAEVTVPTKTSDLDNDSNFMSGMTILRYGSSTWNDFLTAYQSNHVVYCRASSNSNPASGAQLRLAFMAYVASSDVTPTEVEFQYYRSVSSHTASQQGDQVYVYKLNKTNGWSVTVREASVKVVAGTGLGGTYSNGTMTLTGPTKVSDLTNDSGFITSYTETDPVFTASVAHGISSSDISNWNGKSDLSISSDGDLDGATYTITDGNTTYPFPSSDRFTTANAGLLNYIQSLAVNGNLFPTTVTGNMYNLVLDGDDIAYDANTSVNAKIDTIITSGGEPNAINTISVNNVNQTITNKNVNIDTLLSGTTSQVTPTQVLQALQAGKNVEITYTHQTYGNIVANTFNYSQGFDAIVSNIVAKYIDPNTNEASYMLFELIGHISSGNWQCDITTLAEASDIPTKVSDLTNDSGFITLADLPIYNGGVS